MILLAVIFRGARETLIRNFKLIAAIFGITYAGAGAFGGNMKNLKYAVTLLIFCFSFSASGQEGSTPMSDSRNVEAERRQSAQNWKHMYFSGFSKSPAKEIDLNQNLVQGLLSMVGAGPAISTGAAVEPKYIINKKGLTVWLALHAVVYAQKPDALEKIYAGEAALNIPSGYLNGIFGEHINWPEPMLAKYDLSIGEDNLFIIPFVIPNDGKELSKLSQSMKAPDGSLEIMGLHEFQESNPEAMLVELAGIAKHIRENEYKETN